jgi:hypothetical protein
MGIAGVFDPIALERPQIVGVAQLPSHPFEDRPVIFLPCVPRRLFKVTLEVLRNPVVVEERVVDIKEKDHLGPGHMHLHVTPEISA